MLNVIEVGKRIEEARTDMGISKKELAERVKVSAATITRYEKGQFADPKIPVLDAIANTLGVNPLWICLRSDEKHAAPPRRKTVKIPVLGSIVAGTPETAFEDVIDWFEIPEALARHGNYFALKVHGDSMSPEICDGDYVILRQQETAESGDICAICINGDECTVKEIQRSHEGVMLVGYNRDVYTPTFYSNEQIERLPLRIEGVVVQCIRKYKEY